MFRAVYAFELALGNARNAPARDVRGCGRAGERIGLIGFGLVSIVAAFVVFSSPGDSLVMLAQLGQHPQAVLDELDRRFGLSGHVEKASRPSA